MVKQLYYQNIQYVILKNQDLKKKQGASGILGNLGLKAPLNKIPLLADIFLKNHKNG